MVVLCDGDQSSVAQWQVGKGQWCPGVGPMETPGENCFLNPCYLM